ncbi:MAG: hypothetical protein GY939_23060 [Actinomycetia bacterium]|nr:hypothetical protein [Actinomycetes bacterium]
MAVVEVREIEVMPYAGGRSFGPFGPYVIRRLEIEHEVDPAHPANAAIIDLEHAVTNSRGQVSFSHDVLELRPELGPSNGRVLVDVVNRGRPTAFRFLNQESSAAFPPPDLPEPGDGHLLAEGWTVLFAGWQFDIDHPNLLGLRAPEALPEGRVLRGEVEYGAQPPFDTDTVPLALPGHQPPAAVEGPATMQASGPDGLELLHVDDTIWSFSDDGLQVHLDGGFKAGHRYRWAYTTAHSSVAGCGLLALRDLAPWARAQPQDRGEGEVGQVVLFGVSQCGRIIRQFLADGLNANEDDARAYDAVMPLIGGGRLGQFNQRFANPGILPTGDEGLGGPVTYEELLAPYSAKHRPKVMALNTSTEYWRGDAALVHPSSDADIRVHLVASTQHTPGIVPQMFEDPYLATRGQSGFSTVDYGPIVRALLDQLTAWVDDDTTPTPSQVPTEEELTTRAAVLDRFRAQGWPVPDEASFGEPAGPVPALDDDGNELGGIRLADVTTPIGTHTGWNSRHPDCGAPNHQLMLRGTTRWFGADELGRRYRDLDHYLKVVGHRVDELVAARLIRAPDRDLVLSSAQARWEEAKTVPG